MTRRQTSTPTADERFWANVRVTRWLECWLWTGYANWQDYGRFRGAGRKKVLAHRFAFELVHGALSAEFCVLHACDTPACVNPAHLRAGTVAQNNADRNAKVRQARGTANGRAVLSEANVASIRRAFASGISVPSLANSFGVNSKAIYQVVNGRTWRHLA